MLDILCVGDSVIDIFLRIPEKNPNFTLEENGKKLLMNLGEKINVEEYVLDVGGNATNTSIGISRLGLNVGILAEIGQDEFSEKILARLKEEKINIDNLVQTANAKTSFSVILNYLSERNIFGQHVKRDHNFIFEKIATKYIYLTSLGNDWENAYEKTLEFAKEKGAVLAFNPGTLQIIKRDKIVMDIIERCDYLFLNKEEAEEILYGKELDIEIKDRNEVFHKLLFGLKSLGAKNIIVTDSDNGSYACDADSNIYFLGVTDSTVLEKTGAGDSYAAGFISATIEGKSIEEAMVWGAINAASVISKIGAIQGLLNKNELTEKINLLNDFKTKKIS